jgi:hypothetical protein
MTPAEIKISWLTKIYVSEKKTESGTIDGIKAVHAPEVDGGVTLFLEQMVSDPTHPSGIKWDLKPIEGATDILPGTSVDFIIIQKKGNV